MTRIQNTLSLAVALLAALPTTAVAADTIYEGGRGGCNI